MAAKKTVDSVYLRGDDQKLSGEKSLVVRRVMMSLIEGSHYFKTNKEGAQKIVAKYQRSANKAYLDRLL